jgi:ribonuclease BN (tRNA processing enzyme)
LTRSGTLTNTLFLPASTGSKKKYVFLTHLHADFVAEHLELRDRVGARN